MALWNAGKARTRKGWNLTRHKLWSDLPALHVSLKPSDNKLIYGFSFSHPVADVDIVEAAESSKDGLCSGHLGMVKNLAANCTSPAPVDGRLYVRVLDGVVCYDLRKKTQP